MSVIVNNQVRTLPEGLSLAALLVLISPSRPFAVARNHEFVPCSEYETCLIYPGDQIEIVGPMVGG